MEDVTLDLTGSEEIFIIGEVLAIYFSNPSNFYKVMLIEVEETNADYSENNIVITGNFGRVQEGATYQFTGKFTNHPKYGVQFQADRYETEIGRASCRERV